MPVFPCVPDGTLDAAGKPSKAPACANGYKDATTDRGQIIIWWTENKNYNIGFPPHLCGWGVVDLDPGGFKAWDAIKPDYPTFTVKTPRDGRHFYYKGALPTLAWSPGKQRTLGEHLDTRGEGGYVLLPPSIVGGKAYEVLVDIPVAPLPSDFAARLAPRDYTSSTVIEQLDDRGNVHRATNFLRDCVERGRVAVLGQGGNDLTLEVAYKLRDLGLSPEMAGELLKEHWYPHCVPNYQPEFIDTLVTNAYRYPQNKNPGRDAVGTPEEAFGQTAQALIAAEPVKKRTFHWEDWDDQENGPDPVWLIKDLLRDRGVTLMYGEPGSYKSFLALDLALGVATGTETFRDTPKKGVAIYCAIEGKDDTKKARRRAWQVARGVEGRIDTFFVTPTPLVGLDQGQEFIDDFIAQANGRPIKLIVLDTLAVVMTGLDENATKDAVTTMHFATRLVEIFNCLVLIIHHSAAGEERGRGARAAFANSDGAIYVKADEPTRAVEVWVKRHKDAEVPKTPWTFEGKKLGQSLAFFPTKWEDHKRALIKFDPLGKDVVGAALRDLKANEENGVSTNVLASALTPPIENESVEQRTEAVKKTARLLGAAGRGKLAAYRSGELWSLPG